MRKYISFDVGGSKVKHGLLLENGTILSKSSYPTHCNDLDRFLNDMVKTINMYAKENRINGVAVSLPGYINPYSGYSERAGAINALHGQNLKRMLEERIPYQVEIENDGNCAAIAEKTSGNARHCRSFVCMTIGTGVGGGIFHNGKLLRGHNFRGGEVGFMITNAGIDEGVMHDISSTTALINAYKRVKGIRDYEKVSGEMVFLEAEKNDAVKTIIDDWIKKISYGIFNLAATLNPEKILIGGAVTAQADLLPKINRQLEKLYWWKEIKVPVERCKHQNEAGMIGAMYHLIRRQERG